MGNPLDSHAATAAELKDRIVAERTGRALLVYRDGDGHQRLLPLTERDRITVGRGPASDLRLNWDREVSRAHAELACIGDEWAISDDGLSTNGTFRNDERVHGRQRLRDGDQLRFGRTVVAFRAPMISDGGTATVLPNDAPSLPISQTQRLVLVALCRPLRANPYATPATNQQVAGELHLGVDAVKVHLRALYRRMGIETLPQNEKRARLAELAIHRGLVTTHELEH